MSDYSRKKALRVPVEFTGFDISKSEDIYDDLESYIKSVNTNFKVSPTERFFVDYELPCKKYANGDWGKNRPLYESEKAKYKDIFSQIGVTDMNKVRVVEYCWYDCSEAPDYYDESSDKDDFYKEI